ncbi:MAG TPA: sigma-E factor negative regulatory protein [Burkholderiales bacterium]|jgi:sigma-E factor negative regulatory protein RseA
MKEKLSAFVDGEFQSDELRVHLARIKSDAELRSAWNVYHLIGDALRGQISPDLTSGVLARLHEEPTMLAPRRVRPAFSRLGWHALSAAAGMAAVALVVWTASPVWHTETQMNAKSEDVDLARSRLSPVTTVSVPGGEANVSVSDSEVENYLYAHQPYSHTSAIQGVAPYARTVADERGVRNK